MDSILSPQIKITCLTRTQIKILRISKKQRIRLDIFVIFLEKKLFFLISICSFQGVQYFRLELSIFYSKLLSATNQSFCATESDIDLQTILHSSMNYWFQYCDLH